MTDERLAELVAKLDAGTIAPDEADELKRAVSDSESLRAAIGGQLFLSRALHTARRPGSELERLMAALPAAPDVRPAMRLLPGGGVKPAAAIPRRSRWLPAAAVALAAAAAGILIGLRMRPAPSGAPTATVQAPPSAAELAAPLGPAATLAGVHGRVVRLNAASAPARLGEGLPAGTWLSTGAASGATLRTSAGVHKLTEHAVVGVLAPTEGSPANFFLAQGLLQTTGTSPVSLHTPHAQLALVGGTVTVRDTQTRVEVTKGRAQITDLARGRTTTVDTGHSALVTTGVEEAPVTVVPSRNALLIVGRKDQTDEEPSDEDKVIRDRLIALGFTVEVAFGDRPMPPLEGRTLLVASSSIDSQFFDWDLRNVTIPIVTWELMIYVRLGLVADNRKNWGRVVNTDSLIISNPTHPLAAGLSGTVRVSNKRGDLSWGMPSTWAAFVAHAEKSQTEFVIFGYEKGDRMPYGAAPARRVGLFLYQDLTLGLTAEGWRLFDAAIKWAAAAP